jgi:phosphonate transport system substrate-binding protein
VGFFRRFVTWLWLAWLVPGAAGAAPAAPLQLGVFPNLSVQVLVNLYQPLADDLARQLKRPVRIETAPDFRVFMQRAAAGRYDIMVAAPHFGQIALRDYGYLPLYRYRNGVEGLLVVRRGAPFRTLQDLRGQRIALADPLAIVVLEMQRQLRQAGLQAGRDYAPIASGTHNNAAYTVLSGRAEAGVIGRLPLQQLPENERLSLQVLARTAVLPGQVIVYHPRLAAADVACLRRALPAFKATPAGRRFLDLGDFGDLEVLDDTQQKSLEFATDVVRKRLAGGAR